jgi:threonine/homoserine/homoserine lactone efflux protein
MTPPDLLLLAKGAGIGFSIAAPVGPIGLLCLRRTLAHGRLSGFVSGLGAATADACYGSVAGFGLTAVSSFLIRQETVFRIVGGLFLLYLGIRTMLARPARQTADSADEGLLKDYVSTLALTLTNPFTILSFAAIFSGLGIVRAQSHAVAGLLVLGVFLGSTAWWLTLSALAGAARRRFGAAFLRGVNLVSGLAIIGFGGVTLAELVRSLLAR